jgi:hypothetical protein
MKKDDIPYDGFGNVIEMLHHADAAFRERILRGIAQRDPALARRLMEATRASLSRDDRESDNFTVPGESYLDSHDILERTQRSVRSRTYGR